MIYEVPQPRLARELQSFPAPAVHGKATGAVWVFFLPWCLLGLYREALPLENTLRGPTGSGGFGWGPDHVFGVSLHQGISHPPWVSLVLAPFSVSWDFPPKIRQDPAMVVPTGLPWS